MFRSPITIALLVAVALTLAVIGAEMSFAKAPSLAEAVPLCATAPAFSAHLDGAQIQDGVLRPAAALPQAQEACAAAH